MKKTKLEKLDLTLFEEVLDNGMHIYVVPKNNVNGIYVTLSTKFGSIHDEFIPNGEKEYVKVPLGVAHFLEHKVFEQKDGVDPFTFFSERGCDANANTSNYKTTYLFSGFNSFSDNINYLLDYVQSPYFTDENVEKEKGIIEQEIKMYDDDPYFRIYDGIIHNSFIKHPIKYPIAGKVEDVYSITKEDLYTCYNTFYHPGNMFMVIVGNVDPKDCIDIIKENQSKKNYSEFKNVLVKEYDEPNKVEKEYDTSIMDIEIPKVGIGFKIDCSKINKNIADIKSYLSIMLDIKIGSTSLFMEKLKKDNLVTNEFDVTLINTNKHILIVIITETKEVDKVLKLLNDEFKSIYIEESDFERKKKVKKSNCIYKSDSIYSINNKIMANIINYNSVIYDDYKKIDELNINDMNKIIDKINLENKTVYILDTEK